MVAETTTRFRLIDAAALVAAAAAGLALGRGVAAWERGTARDAAADYAVSLALAWTLAVLTLNLTRYRAARPEFVACRPGYSAALAVAVERAAEFLYAATVMPMNGEPFLQRLTFAGLPSFLMQTTALCVTNAVRGSSSAGAVAAVWLFAALAGCWRPEKTWLDRTGRALGAFWLLVAAVYWLSVWALPDATMPPPAGPVAPGSDFDFSP